MRVRTGSFWCKALASSVIRAVIQWSGGWQVLLPARTRFIPSLTYRAYISWRPFLPSVWTLRQGWLFGRGGRIWGLGRGLCWGSRQSEHSSPKRLWKCISFCPALPPGRTYSGRGRHEADRQLQHEVSDLRGK